jgi:hypothetical protein
MLHGRNAVEASPRRNAEAAATDSHQLNPSSMTWRICGPSMPLRPKRSSVRASAAKSFPVIFRTSSTSASIDGVLTPAAAPKARSSV